MGWKTSLLIIENPDADKTEKMILQAIGKADYEFEKEVTFEECLYPKDKSIYIGYYKDNIIISDNYQLTTASLDKARNLSLTEEEQKLCELFPKSEIVTIACHSVVNYHGYSLIQNGEKKRLKTISSDSLLKTFGKRTIEEEQIYKKSYQKEGQNFWVGKSNSNEEYSEDQLLEEFVFGFAKRRLGIYLDQAEDQLMESILFKKYKKKNLVKRILKALKIKG